MEYRIEPIQRWPEGWNRNRRSNKFSPFRSTWASTLELLDRELRHVYAKEIVLQIDVKESQVRRDGMLRADAQADYDGVILSFTTRKFGTLTYPCNAFRGNYKSPGWQDNLRAIGFGLESLRKIERYGIAERGQQYAGWKELGSGVVVPAAGLTYDSAWERLNDAQMSGASWGEVRRKISKVYHPDAGGDEATFKSLMEAVEFLEVG